MGAQGRGIVEDSRGGIWTDPSGGVVGWGDAIGNPDRYLAARDEAVRRKVTDGTVKLADEDRSDFYDQKLAPSKDPMLMTVDMVTASHELGIDVVGMLKLIASGELKTCTVGDDERVTRFELDRFVRERQAERDEVADFLDPRRRRPDHQMHTVTHGAGLGTEAEAGELAELIGGDAEAARAAARRRAGR